MQVDTTMVAYTGSDVILLNGPKHNTHAMLGDTSRITTPESSHQKADFFGVLQFKNKYIRLFDGEKTCIIPLNKIIGYHNSYK